ncbi:S8 family serine peptidase [Gemmatimonas sp.]|uniref:S8 family peptidase n=1 Tax=Gemmatimonas sp. TaxID=1962908 RepID=UPI003F706897
MPRSLVQIVLEPNRFVGPRQRQNARGPKRDFFAGSDEAFRLHRDRLQETLSRTAESLERSAYGGVAYAKVRLQRSALAKSHRPTGVLFAPDRTPILGAHELGQLLVEVTPEQLTAVASAVGRAEDTTTLVEDKQGKLRPKPSRQRSEVGAIEQFSLWGGGDKRAFTAEEAVRTLADPATGSSYRVELFRGLPTASEAAELPPRYRELFKSFLAGLAAVGEGLDVRLVDGGAAGARTRMVLSARLSTASTAVRFLDAGAEAGRPAPFETRVERHERLLQFLDAHPLVRTVDLSPRLEHSTHPSPQAPSSDDTLSPGDPAATGTDTPHDAGVAGHGEVRPPTRGAGPYPLVAVIDGGISPALGDWVRHRVGVLAEEDRDEDHGTFIAGLLVAGQAINGPDVVPEADGCDLIDVDVFPPEPTFPQYYQTGVDGFLDNLEQIVAELRQQHGVRIFNLSINVTERAEPHRYSVEASRLDRMALAHDVVFVISAGNLTSTQMRSEWSANTTSVLSELARTRHDGLQVPAESIHNVSVTALNPPRHLTCMAHVPAAYARRGPGLEAGVKPDLAHVSGAAHNHPHCGTGLESLRPDGSVACDNGTSYAAPQAAKTLALLDAAIEGHVRRETLMALLIHSAALPAALAVDDYAQVARDLVGFGLPQTAGDILERGDHEITMVFESRLRDGQELTFKFPWPASLVNPATGACRGEVRMTLVSTPPVDVRFGSELVRVNISASLQQEHHGKFQNQVAHADLPPTGDESSEQALIDHALKWSATKRYRRLIPQGIGRSSTWRLHVTYLTRDQEVMPPEGVPFTVVLTISDPEGQAPVFNEVRQSLSGVGVQLADLQTAARITSRT